MSDMASFGILLNCTDSRFVKSSLVKAQSCWTDMFQIYDLYSFNLITRFPSDVKFWELHIMIGLLARGLQVDL